MILAGVWAWNWEWLSDEDAFDPDGAFARLRYVVRDERGPGNGIGSGLLRPTATRLLHTTNPALLRDAAANPAGGLL